MENLVGLPTWRLWIVSEGVISDIKVIRLPSVFGVDLFFGARDQVDQHSLCTFQLVTMDCE